MEKTLKIQVVNDHKIEEYIKLLPNIEIIKQKNIDLNENVILVKFFDFNNMDGLRDKIKDFLLKNSNNICIINCEIEPLHLALKYIEDYSLTNFILNKQIKLIVASENKRNDIDCVTSNGHFNIILEQRQNAIIAKKFFNEVYNNKPKKYNFLFLNGRKKNFRDNLFQIFRQKNLLENSLYSYLDENIILPSEYDEDKHFGHYSKDYLDTYENQNNTIWILWPKLYTDTYFSVVTENTYDNDNIIFTEKTGKVLFMGHPFIIASAPYYYEYLKDRGFKTYSDFIDESFDKETNHDKRLLMIANEVERLSKTNLDDFLNKTKSIGEYNSKNFIEICKKTQNIYKENIQDFFTKKVMPD